MSDLFSWVIGFILYRADIVLLDSELSNAMDGP